MSLRSGSEPQPKHKRSGECRVFLLAAEHEAQAISVSPLAAWLHAKDSLIFNYFHFFLVSVAFKNKAFVCNLRLNNSRQPLG